MASAARSASRRFGGHLAQAAHRQPGSGEGLPPDQVIGQAE